MTLAPGARRPELIAVGSVIGPRLLHGLDRHSWLGLTEHLAAHGPVPLPPTPNSGRRAAEHPWITAAAAAGISGRGGGGYPLADKMRAVSSQRGRPVVVVNAAEGEPASRKDAVLLSRTPHLVLDGAQAAAAALGATEIFVWLHAGSLAVPSLERAVEQRRSAGLEAVPVRLALGPDRYVAGQASAVVRALSGGPALPRTQPPRVAQKGVKGRPTLLSNAETLAHLALVVRRGPEWFASVGTQSEPGTLLVTVPTPEQYVVLEVPRGFPLLAALETAGVPDPASAPVLVGGYAGGWLVPQRLPGALISEGSLADLGLSLGVGLLAPLGQGRCPVSETVRLVRWLAGESAGQCGPCANGLPAIATVLGQVEQGLGGARALAQLNRWTTMVRGRGACHHPDGVALLVESTVRSFGDHLAEHAAGVPCAGAAAAARLPVPVGGGAR